MDLIQLKIGKDSSITKYIKIIRKFDNSLSIGTIKQRIEENDFVMGYDLECYDVLEDINGNEIDRKKDFSRYARRTLSGGSTDFYISRWGNDIYGNFGQLAENIR